MNSALLPYPFEVALDRAMNSLPHHDALVLESAVMDAVQDVRLGDDTALERLPATCQAFPPLMHQLQAWAWSLAPVPVAVGC